MITAVYGVSVGLEITVLQGPSSFMVWFINFKICIEGRRHVMYIVVIVLCPQIIVKVHIWFFVLAFYTF